MYLFIQSFGDFFIFKLSSKDVHICEKNNKQQLKKRLKSFSCFDNFLPNVFKMMPKATTTEQKIIKRCYRHTQYLIRTLISFT
jgi:hypothetical protein